MSPRLRAITEDQRDSAMFVQMLAMFFAFTCGFTSYALASFGSPWAPIFTAATLILARLSWAAFRRFDTAASALEQDRS